MFSSIFVFVGFIAVVDGSYCGPFSVPFSLEHTSSGGLILGCARSPCLGISPLHETALQWSSFQGNDGFIRYDTFGEQPPTYGTVSCQPDYAPQSCSGPTQWLGGIAPGAGFPNQTFEIVCCTYGPLQFARTIGVALVSRGQIYTGGNVTASGELSSFDYISNVQRGFNPDGSLVYSVFVKRLSCLPQPLQVPPAYPAPSYSQGYGSGAPSFYCFSGDSTVELTGGEKKRLDELEIGDWVYAVNNGQLVTAVVDKWIHRKTSESAEFLKIQLENEKSIKITRKHYIYKTPCRGDVIDMEKYMVFAEELQIGDCLFVKDNEEGFLRSKITSISKITEIGFYAPKTATGNLFVNGIFVSCYTNLKHEEIQDGYIRMTSWLKKMIYDSEEEVELIPGVSALLAFAKDILTETF